MSYFLNTHPYSYVGTELSFKPFLTDETGCPSSQKKDANNQYDQQYGACAGDKTPSDFTKLKAEVIDHANIPIFMLSLTNQ
jgi:hypothetical protein